MQKPPRKLYFECIALVMAAAFWGCAGSGHSSENFSTENLNSCEKMADGKDIEKIHQRQKVLRKKNNPPNQNQTDAKLDDLDGQIQSIQSADATQMKNCKPTYADESQ